MYLPTTFTDRMKELLGAEYPEFLASYEQKRMYGLRVNTRKIQPEELEEMIPFTLNKIPWIPNGYYYEGNVQPAKHPYYFAGLYYLQEPSAMTPAAMLEVQPGDAVLDLCAAPGGKATELGAKTKGEGILAANDISSSRAKALLKNLELFGIGNLMILSEPIERLAEPFHECFDKILLDAPCSGEGMFRKDPAIIKNWEKNGPEHYAAIQRELLLKAVDLLKPGGRLLYSTCTFSPEENEGTVQYLLDRRKDMKVIALPEYEGFSPGRPDWITGGSGGLEKTVRIWPHKMAGEGHYLALLEKEGTAPAAAKVQGSRKKLPEELTAFLKDAAIEAPAERLEIRGEKVYLMPEYFPRIQGLRFLRAGLYLGGLKKKRFEPSQALAMHLKASEYQKVLSFPAADERVIRYLKGETIQIDDSKKEAGWYLICVDQYPLGWGKVNNGVVKNKYHQGWRWMS